MTMQQVIYALEVASGHSVSKAAERLYISQSALSQQIRRLEEELGYALFIRTAHGIQLTEEGENFCNEAEPVVAGWRSLCAAAKKNREPEKLRLRLGIGSRVYSNHLFQEVLAYFEANPEIEVTFLTEAGQDVLEPLRRGELDLALDRLPVGDMRKDQDSFYACPLIREQQCVLLSPWDPRAARPVLSFRDLEGSTMISGLEDSAEDRTLKSVFRRNHISPSRIYRSDGIETSMRMVRDGMGAALGPKSFADYYQVAAVPLEPETWISLQFICLKSGLKRPEIRRLRDYLQQICSQREVGTEQNHP